MTTGQPALILASGSRYRRELLQRITTDFETHSPDVDESPLGQETPAQLAARLAVLKATTVAEEHPEAIIIGSDQVAALGETTLGKPGDHATAAGQLQRCSGATVRFYTSVAIICRTRGFRETHTDITTVQFRDLSSAEIDSYLKQDQPWNCAGSFRSEGLGAALFDSIENSDPTALIGLPLIWVAASLRRAGIAIL